jgi:hypothetical protein
MIMTGAAPAGKDLCEEVKEKYPNVKFIVQGISLLQYYQI